MQLCALSLNSHLVQVALPAASVVEEDRLCLLCLARVEVEAEATESARSQESAAVSLDGVERVLNIALEALVEEYECRFRRRQKL